MRSQLGRDALPSKRGPRHTGVMSAPQSGGESQLEPWFPAESGDALRGYSGLRKIMSPPFIHNPGGAQRNSKLSTMV